MKPIIKPTCVSVAFILCISYCYAQDYMTRVAYEYIFMPNAVNTQKKFVPLQTTYAKFDENGNIIEECVYGELVRNIKVTEYDNPDNNLKTISEFRSTGSIPGGLNTVKFNKYNNQNQLIENELWRFSNNQKNYLISRTYYEYNANGTLYREIQVGADNNIMNSKTKIRLRDKIVTIDTVFTFYSAKKEMEESRDTLIVDGLQRIAEETHYSNDRFVYRNQYFYGNRSLKQLSYHKKQDSLSVVTHLYYDANKKLLSEYRQVKDSDTKTKQVYLYDRKGRLAKKLHYESGRLTGYTKYEYITEG